MSGKHGEVIVLLNPTHFAGEFPKLTGGGLSTGRAQGRHGAMLRTLQGGAGRVARQGQSC